ncbi:MAG: DMT family transporter [Clostridia bacterium]|nr:DMT family transporter [Clostridia bacterium]
MTISKEKFFTKTYVVVIGALICCMLWGSAFPCVKIGYTLFNVDTSSYASLILFAGVRFTLAGVLVIAFGSLSQKKFLVPKKENIWRVGVVALFQTALQYTFFYIGLSNLTGVKSSILNGLGVFFTIIAACFLFRTEKFNLIKLAGCVLGFGGVVIMNLDGFSLDMSLTGEGFIIFSGLSSAIAAGFVKIFSKKENTTALCGWQFFCGGLLLVIIGLSLGGRISAAKPTSFLMLFYLAFLSACAFTLQGYLLKYNPVSRIAVFKSTNPLFGAVFSAIILGESEQLLSFTTLIALALVCGGIFIINTFGEKREKQNTKTRKHKKFHKKVKATAKKTVYRL